MKAIVCPKYGLPEVLQHKEENKPIPKNNELLIRVCTVFVGIEDIMQRKGKPYFGRFFVGLTKPRKPILGTEFCGEIEEIGKDVRLFKKGDSVFGVTGADFGCYAEYICMHEAGLLSIKPPNMTNEEAAPVCGAMAAWNLLIAIANIQSGQKVLIYGAAGSIGLAAVQIAKVFGAEVTGVCSSSNLEMVISLGADNVFDNTGEDFTKNGLTYDVILDVSGKPSTLNFKNSLSKSGFYLTVYPTVSILLQTFWTSLFNGKKVVFSATGLKPVSDRLAFLKELIKLFEEGKLKTIIDKSFQLEQMAEAHRYIESGPERGNVVVTI
ncbi:MAG: NAD(P)-dependent alcohol dehydrogenase [Bacteroidales bacterium]|nr:NAD(P)-dependent alcohol dehydrogenase [Bacteroidales bacterium]